MQFIRYVFNRFAKASSDIALLRTTSGKPFQTRGAAAAKERSPKDVFILTTSSICGQALFPQNDDYHPSSSRWWGILEQIHLGTCAPASPFCTVCVAGLAASGWPSTPEWYDRSVVYQSLDGQLHSELTVIASAVIIIIIIIIIINDIYIARIRKFSKCVNQQLNRKVFNCFLNTSREMSDDRSSAGKLFQTTGPCTAKLRLP